MVYLSIMLSTVVFSRKLNKLVWISALIFGVSDCFLIYNMAAAEGMFMKTVALLIYYASLLVYGVAIWEISSPDKKI